MEWVWEEPRSEHRGNAERMWRGCGEDVEKLWGEYRESGRKADCGRLPSKWEEVGVSPRCGSDVGAVVMDSRP